MDDKRGPICGLPAKSNLTAESAERFVEAEKARRDKNDADREQQKARLNAFGDHCPKWRGEQSADQQAASYHGKGF